MHLRDLTWWCTCNICSKTPLLCCCFCQVCVWLFHTYVGLWKSLHRYQYLVGDGVHVAASVPSLLCVAQQQKLMVSTARRCVASSLCILLGGVCCVSDSRSPCPWTSHCVCHDSLSGTGIKWMALVPVKTIVKSYEFVKSWCHLRDMLMTLKMKESTLNQCNFQCEHPCIYASASQFWTRLKNLFKSVLFTDILKFYYNQKSPKNGSRDVRTPYCTQ